MDGKPVHHRAVVIKIYTGSFLIQIEDEGQVGNAVLFILFLKYFTNSLITIEN